MKKIICALLALCMSAALLAGCGNGQAEAGGTLTVVTTVFPEYDWVMNILGDSAENADVTMLLSSGVDLHSYQPSADDLIQISRCDLFIYVGGESDAWVGAALETAANPNRTVISLMEVLGEDARTEEQKEGMEAESESGAEEEAEEPEYDEHVWLSLKNAARFTSAIAEALGQADTVHADAYAANAAAYIEKLNALDARYKAAVDGATVKTLLFGDRFPFRYLTEDYGLDYYAAFAGCSAESEASFETVAFLAQKVDELGLSAVLTLEGSDRKLAETVVASTAEKSARILSLDSMQSTTWADVQAGTTYLSVMENNLAVLTEALK